MLLVRESNPGINTLWEEATLGLNTRKWRVLGPILEATHHGRVINITLMSGKLQTEVCALETQNLVL